MSSVQVFFNYNITVEAFNRLITLLNDDEQLLKSGSLRELSESFDRKNDLISFLSRQKDTLSKHSEENKVVTEEQKQTLIALNTELDNAAMKSKRAITKAMYINEKILGIAANFVSKNESKSVGYNRDGSKRNYSRFKEAPYVALNQKL
jgi:hypothetical protein